MLRLGSRHLMQNLWGKRQGTRKKVRGDSRKASKRRFEQEQGSEERCWRRIGGGGGGGGGGGVHGSHARNISFFDLVDYCLYCMDDMFPPPNPRNQGPQSRVPGSIKWLSMMKNKAPPSMGFRRKHMCPPPPPPPVVGGRFFSLLFVKCHFDSICALEDSGVELWYFVLCNTRVEREREG